MKPPRNGAALRQFRKKHGLSQSIVAAALGIHQPQISIIEGKNLPLDPEIAAKLREIAEECARTPEIAKRVHIPKDGVGLRRFRERRGLSQSQLAKIMRVSQSQISLIETGGEGLAPEAREALRKFEQKNGGLVTGKPLAQKTLVRGPRPSLVRARRTVSSARDTSGDRRRTKEPTPVRAILDLLEEAGISWGSVARACGISMSSLKQYSYMRRSAPEKFLDKLEAFVRRVSE